VTTPNESTPSAPHIGVWSAEWREKLMGHLGNRVVRRAYFSNTSPVGFLNEPSTHHAWVIE